MLVAWVTSIHGPSHPSYISNGMIALMSLEERPSTSLSLRLPAKGGLTPIPKPFGTM